MPPITTQMPPSAIGPDTPRRPNINTTFDEEFIVVGGYSSGIQRILQNTVDEVELRISHETFDRMENDPVVWKGKSIIITNVLADDLQFAPGATEEEVGADEYAVYVWMMEYAERIVKGLSKPYREVLEGLLGNAVKYGHGVGETEFNWRMDSPSSKPPEKDNPSTGKAKKSLSAFLGQGKLSMLFRGWLTSDAKPEKGNPNIPDESSNPGVTRPTLQGEKLRLMPTDIKVKPRNSTRFVVDDYMNVWGLIPAYIRYQKLAWNEIISRQKFLVLTLNKMDEDPRGKSMYRAAFNYYQLKTQVPTEMLRFILEEATPKAIGTLPPANENQPYEQETIKGVKQYLSDGITPKMITAAESMFNQIKGFRSGAGAIVPNGASIQPYKKGYSGAADADLFSKIIKTIDTQMEFAILLQTLAQSEGEHQSKSASSQVAQVLYSLFFWIRWLLAVMTLRDLIGTTVEINIGTWALRYLPLVSLGDFMRRDWIQELEAYSDAYFKGFVDDTQRPELMTLLNMPKPGKSRNELLAEMGVVPGASQDPNGNPGQPNHNRPDKQPATKDRNKGNGTQKKGVRNETIGFSDVLTLVHNRECFVSHSGHLFHRART